MPWCSNLSEITDNNNNNILEISRISRLSDGLKSRGVWGLRIWFRHPCNTHFFDRLFPRGVVAGARKAVVSVGLHVWTKMTCSPKCLATNFTNESCVDLVMKRFYHKFNS